jgi:hypothetical protein
MRNLLVLGACAALVACGGKAADGGSDDGTTITQDPGTSQPGASSSGNGNGSTPMHPSQVVGTGFSQATAIMAVGPNLYVTTKASMMGGVLTTNGALYMLPKAGGQALLLAADHRGASYTDLALDANGDVIVGTSDGRILRVPMFGGAETELMNGAPEIVSLATDSTHIYFAHAKGSVLSVDYSGHDPALLATPGSSISAMTVAGDSLYVAYDAPKSGGLLRIHTADQSMNTVAATGVGLSGLSVVNDVAYLSSQSGDVLATNVSGGATSHIAKSQPSPSGVLADSNDVFWLSVTGANLWHASHDGKTQAPIAVVAKAVASAHALASDDASIYVLTDSEVVRVQK